MQYTEVDVLIIGGGLVGMALMIALKLQGYNVRLLEIQDLTADAKTSPALLDTRSIALSPSSIRILKALNVWAELQNKASPIHSIHISEQGKFGQAKLNQEHTEAEPLGAVIEIHELSEALKNHIDLEHIIVPAKVIALDAYTGEVTVDTRQGEQSLNAKWIIAADGADSPTRKLCGLGASYKAYGEHALATNIALRVPHGDVAYERFTPTGPLALLPLQGPHMALVWTLNPEDAQAIKEMPESVFLQQLQRAFGYRLGRFQAVGRRATYPLKQVLMQKLHKGRVLFIGNAAHTLHPVAGQGFNLGLRDVAMLAECALKDGLLVTTLERYLTYRKTDQNVITSATDGLVSLFQSQFPGVSMARRLGLLTLDNSPFLKRMILRYAKGFGGVVSDLVCEQVDE